MSFLEKLKSVFRSKPPVYKLYNHTELKMIAMKCRIYLEEYYKKCIQSIQASDSVLFQRKQSPGDCYRILQEIGRHVIQVQTLKIYHEILRKIQDKSPLIIKTNGDIALLKAQLNWFQCLLWYRKCKKAVGLQQLHAFCYNFFKGVDITFQITPKCQIFQIYPIMLFLDPDCIIPLKKVYPEIQQYLKTELDEQCKKQIFKLNKQDIKDWVKKQRIQHHHQFLSKSKSKSKSPVRPHFTPKHDSNQESWKNSSTVNINSSKRIDDNKANNNNSLDVDDSKRDKISNTDKTNNNTSPMSTSFYRKVMQTSKVKEKQYYNCDFCGKVSEREKAEDVGGFQKYCQACWVNMNLKQGQNKIKQIEQKKEKKSCKICSNAISFQNDLSFSNSKAYLKGNSNSFSFSEESLCESCQKQLEKTSNKQKTDRFIDQLFPKEPVINNFDFQERNQEHDTKPKSVPEYDDEEDSLKFIRQTIVQKKKPIKKPYMVSIYGRAEYVQLKKKQ